MKRLLYAALLGISSLATAFAAPSILDIKHSITDDNIIAPESFDTKAIELEENFYLQNYSADAGNKGAVRLGTPEEYELKLSQLPTEIEMPYNDVVRKYIEMYLGKRSKLVSDMLALHNYYGTIFVEELEKEGLPLELQYLPVIESAINPNAVSRAGATGLWQFMPGTAKGLGMEVNTLVDQRRDPRASSRYAAKYLKQLYDIYGDWSLAIAAYNCGPGNVNKAMKRAGGGKKDFWEIYNYLPNETRGYLPAFIAANYVMNYYKDHNISPRIVKQPLVTDTVQVSNRVNFNQIAAVLNIPVEEIRMLNPQFRKDIIPGNNHPYALTLPSAQILSYVMSEDEILDYDKDLYAQRTYVEPGKSSSTGSSQNGNDQPAQQSENASENNDLAQADLNTPIRITHIVAHGENLRDIARKYNVSATDIKRWNNLRRAKVKEGDELVIETYDRANYTGGNDMAHNSVKSDVPAPPKKEQQTAQPAVPERKHDNQQKSTAKTDVPPAPAKNNTSNNKTAQNPPAKNSSTDNSSAKNTTSNNKSNQTASTGKNQSKSQTTAAASETKSQKSKRVNNQQTSANKNDKNSKNNTKNNQKNNNSKGKQTAKQKTLTVKKGDSLEKLAKANGTTVDDIKKANGLKSDRINEGQELKMPKAQAKGKNSGNKNASASKNNNSKSSKGKATAGNNQKSSKKKR